MDPFRSGVAILPLAFYGLLLGWINLRRRPYLMGGLKDRSLLGLAVMGIVLVGPMELFMPEAAVTRFGAYVWILLISFYLLCLSLVVLLSRHRLVIYNATLEQLRPTLSRLAQSLDSEARWAGDGLALPRLGVQLHVDAFPALRNVSLVATGDQQRFEGWIQLELELQRLLKECEVRPNPQGAAFVGVSLLLALACVLQMVASPHELAQGFRDMLRL